MPALKCDQLKLKNNEVLYVAKKISPRNQITSSTKFKDKKIVKIYMQLQNVNTSRYLEIENDILKRGIKMPNNHIQDIIDSVLPQISFKK